MKTSKVLGFAPLMLALMVAGASARGYGKPGATAPMEGAQMEQMRKDPGVSMSRFESGRLGEIGIYYTGTLSAIDLASNELTVKTQVPGLFGPQTRDVPFKAGENATLSICFKSVNACDSYFGGEVKGWEVLGSLEDIKSLTSAERRVIVIGNAETNEIVHVQIVYGV